MNFLQLSSLSDLSCLKCNKLLSYFPIYSNSDGSTCGRCCPLENGIRNDIYETLAKHMLFPCCYQNNGCLDNLLPKDIAEHEKDCDFRKYLCPILSSSECNWEGFASNLLEHVEDNHPVFLLNEEYFEIDFIRSHDENYLLPYGEDLYIVNRKTDSKTHTFHCTVTCMGYNLFAEELLFKLILSNNNKSHPHEIRNILNATVAVSRDELKTRLNDPVSVIAKIEIFREEKMKEVECDSQSNNDNINIKLLQELECLVCMEYMIPPIFQCVTGHSICKKCKESVNSCPTCRKEFQNTQNFALAQIINHIDYPCKYSKCKFVTKARDIKKHETTCVFAPYPCPVRGYEPCSKEVLLEDLYEHLYKDHYEKVLELDTVCLPFDDNELFEDCYFIKYNTKLFILHIFCNTKNDDTVSFDTQLIGPPEQSSEYRYGIDILDANGNNHRLYFTKPCGSFTGEVEVVSDNNSEIMFSCSQIKHLITDQFNFRVRIFKN